MKILITEIQFSNLKNFFKKKPSNSFEPNKLEKLIFKCISKQLNDYEVTEDKRDGNIKWRPKTNLSSYRMRYRSSYMDLYVASNLYSDLEFKIGLNSVDAKIWYKRWVEHYFKVKVKDVYG